MPTDCQSQWMKWSVLCVRAKNIPIIVFPDWSAAGCQDWDGWSVRCQSFSTSASSVSLHPLQVPRLTWASASTAATAAADTDTWTAWERSLETAWTSSTSPQTRAWAACSRSACGTTTKVHKQTHRSGIYNAERGRSVRSNPSLSLSLSLRSVSCMAAPVCPGEGLADGQQLFLPGWGMALGRQWENGRQGRDRGGSLR